EMRDEIRSINVDEAGVRLLLNGTKLEYLWNATPTSPPVFLPRYPRVVGFPAGDRKTLIFEAVGISRNAPTTLYSLNLHTGEHVALSTQDRLGRMIYDLEGNPRVLETERVRFSRAGPPMKSGTGQSIRIPPPPPQIFKQHFLF